MAHTPVDDDLGEDCERPSFRSPDWLVDYVEEFHDDYNTLLREMVDEEEYERLHLDSQSDALRRLLDIGLGAYYSKHLTRFAAPPRENVCMNCGESGPMVRIGIVADESVDEDVGWEAADRLCLSCGHDQDLSADASGEAGEESVAGEFDGVDDASV